MTRYKEPVEDYVESLAETLSGLTGCEMEGIYGISDMPEFEKSIVDKLLSENIVQSYSLAERALLTNVELFSSSAILASIVDSLRLVNQDNIELGFGLGSGFQLFCDDTMVITAGGGGGGGISWSTKGGSTTFGGGSGYGVQLLNKFTGGASKHKDNWVSIGGGSGCGTCGIDGQDTNFTLCLGNDDTRMDGSAQHVISSNVECGDKPDDNAIPFEQFRDIIQDQFNGKTFGKCKHIRVSGGGGGGGGQVGCGYSEGGGFGFHLDFSCFPSEDRLHHSRHGRKQKRVTQVPYEEVYKVRSTTHSDESTASSDWSAYRDFGSLVQAAASQCNGYGNWECVCLQARTFLRDCAMNTENPTVGETEMSWNAVNCTQLNLHNASYNRIINNSCKQTKHSQLKNTSGKSPSETRKLTQSACDATQMPLFTATQSWGDKITHNLSFYASNSTNESYVNSVVSSLSGIGLTLSMSKMGLPIPALLSATSPVPIGTASTRLPVVWIANGTLCLCFFVLIPLLFLWRYMNTKYFSQRNGYVEL